MNYVTMLKPDLIELAKSRDLSGEGTKAEIIARLRAQDGGVESVAIEDVPEDDATAPVEESLEPTTQEVPEVTATEDVETPVGPVPEEDPAPQDEVSVQDESVIADAEVPFLFSAEQEAEVVFHNTPPEFISGIVDVAPFFYPDTTDIAIVQDDEEGAVPTVTLRLDQPFGYWLPNPLGEWGLGLYESGNH